MKLSHGDREVFGTASAVFALLAMVFALAALIVAGQAWSHSNDTKAEVARLGSGAFLGNRVKVTLEEFAMTPHPNEVKSGVVHFEVDNVGTVTHEMVLVRAPSAAALPRVKVATADRAVGDVDEEVIPASDKIGETGDVPPTTKVTKTFNLAPGTYVMFCNIDNKRPDGTILNHFQHGMTDVISVI